MRRQKQLKKAFGVAAFGQIDFPTKTSNCRISQIVLYKKGEFIDSDYLDMFRISERTRKRFRRTRWKMVR